jgi:hypothetical protein
MLEADYYPQTFNELVELILAGQSAAAGALWDGTMERMAETVDEQRESLASERD